MFILDTNVISDLRRKRPHPAVKQWIMETGWENLSMTVVSVTEIQRGIERIRPSDPALARSLDAWLDGMLAVGEPMRWGCRPRGWWRKCTKPLGFATSSSPAHERRSRQPARTCPPPPSQSQQGT
jgi:hypothetical protein